MSTFSAPCPDHRARVRRDGRVPWIVTEKNGNTAIVHRFETEEEARAFYDSHRAKA